MSDGRLCPAGTVALHDMVAHHLALVNAQASVAEYLMRNDPKAAAALSGISLQLTPGT